MVLIADAEFSFLVLELEGGILTTEDPGENLRASYCLPGKERGTLPSTVHYVKLQQAKLRFPLH